MIFTSSNYRKNTRFMDLGGILKDSYRYFIIMLVNWYLMHVWIFSFCIDFARKVIIIVLLFSAPASLYLESRTIYIPLGMFLSVLQISLEFILYQNLILSTLGSGYCMPQIFTSQLGKNSSFLFYINQPYWTFCSQYVPISESFQSKIGSCYNIFPGSKENTIYNSLWVAQALLRKGYFIMKSDAPSFAVPHFPSLWLFQPD